MLKKPDQIQIQELGQTEVAVDESPLDLPEEMSAATFAQKLEFLWNKFERNLG